MTTLLGIDTSTTHVGVAVGRDGEVLVARSTAASRRHAELLAPTIAEVLAAAGLRPGDLDAVAVATPPVAHAEMTLAALEAGFRAAKEA